MSNDDCQLTHKYRPRRFSDVIGQPEAVATLSGMVKRRKVNQTILISGPWGTGKTTLARILATAVNCENLKNGIDPCFKCASCRGMMSRPPEHTSFVEVNAANARGIDDVRGMVRKAQFSALGAKKRVFLLDEPHQWTPQAMEAMLKPLEEPPPNTIWLLCTTEPQKLLGTITSRCVHIRLRAVDDKDIAKHLKRILAKEGVASTNKKGLMKVAQAANGHVRDAVQMLENVLTYAAASESKKIDLDQIIQKVVERSSKASPVRIAEQIVLGCLTGSATDALRAVEDSGVEAHVLLPELVRLWDQVLRRAASPQLIRAHGANLFREVAKAHTSLDQDSLPDLINAGKRLLQAQERASSFMVDGAALITLTIVELFACCMPLHADDDSSEDSE